MGLHPLGLDRVCFYGALCDRDACKDGADLQLRSAVGGIYDHDRSQTISQGCSVKPITAELVDTLLSRAERMMKQFELRVEQVKLLDKPQPRDLLLIEPFRQDAVAAKFLAELAQHMYIAQQTVNPADLKG